MTPDDILSHRPLVLSQAQREFYFAEGYLCADGLIPADVVDALCAATERLVEESRRYTESVDPYVLAPNHRAAAPRLRRLKCVDDLDPTFWDFATGLPADIAVDLVGPHVRFHHAQLNFKWHDGNDRVEWHQDIPFYPHTNYSPLGLGVYLADTGEADGPITVIPKSHDGPLYDLYDQGGTWTGSMRAADIARLDTASAKALVGPAGTVTVHNCRTVHATPASARDGGRPFLINAYMSADAFAYTVNPQSSRHDATIVRGEPARVAHHDPRPCLVPPDWSAGYSSIYAAQVGEDAA